MNRVAVILPCYNEGLAIAKVVADFQHALPDAIIYVYDNNSSDDTAIQAHQAGAQVRSEPRQGKGHVVRRAFADIDADIYVLADGDGTYDAASASALIALLLAQHLDMVVGTREETQRETYRPGHRFGNRFLTGIIGYLFADCFSDVLSGYRVFSRRFVKSFPTLAQGFEIEAMLTIHALELNLPVAEHSTPYYTRDPANPSKLSTFKDGARILWSIVYLFKESRPFTFFSSLAALMALTSFTLVIPIIFEFLATGLVPRFPTAILATGLMLMGGIFFTSGIVLDSVSSQRREQKRLAYLQLRTSTKVD